MINPIVYVVDDDQAVLKALGMLFRAADLKVQLFESPQEFLETVEPSMTGCVVLDIQMMGLDGLDLHDMLKERDIQMPVIFLTGHADVPKAVRAMKQGAIDFIEKPFNDELLLQRVEYALAKAALSSHRKAEHDALHQRLAQLTHREQEALNLIIAGHSNKEVAELMHISARTVEVHRSRLMHKLEADSLSDLVRMVLGSA